MIRLLLLSSLFFCSVLSFAQSGELDPTFGNQGIVTTDMDSAFRYPNSGKQVLAQDDGSMYIVSETNGITLVSKKHPDGSPDISYGTNGYSVSIPIFGARSIIDSGGRIVLAGYADNNYQHDNETNLAMARLKPNGTLDNMYGTNGIAITDVGYIETPGSLAFQSDGKIIVTVTIQPGLDSPYLVLFRYNQDGSMDNDFKKPTIPYAAGTITVDPDNKIILSGTDILRYTSNGDPDSTFNGDGHVAVSGNAVAVQPDHTILVAGSYSFNDSNYLFSVVRLKDNGAVDSSFGVNGRQTTDFGGINDAATSIMVQPNGAILLAGNTGNETDKDIAIARYNPDGSPDNSFSGDGKQITPFGSPTDFFTDLHIQRDGRLVALGYTNSPNPDSIPIARYDAEGLVDPSFNGGATLYQTIHQGSTFYTGTAIQPDGKVLASGRSWNGHYYAFALARYNADGSPDTTFSGDGKQMTDFSAADGEASALALQGDGKIILAGSVGDNIGLARYNPDGSPDNSFGINGIQVSDFGTADNATAIALQGDGKLVITGTVLARYNSDGSPDLSFNSTGFVTTFYTGHGVAIQPDGKIITISGEANVVIDRYNTDGSVDPTFGNGGETFINQYGTSNYTPSSIVLQNDGKVVIGGYYWFADRGISSKFALLRLDSSGNVDNSFGGDGAVFFGINDNDYGTSVVLQSDQKIIIGGYSWNGSSDDFTLFRFNQNGSPDNTFGSDGIVITRASGAYDRIAALAIAGDKLYAAGFGQYPGNFGVIARYSLAGGGPLPVSLLNFTGSPRDQSVLLQWEIASPKNLTSFVIERSADGVHFVPINSIRAAGVYTTTRNYSVIDAAPLPGVNFYRLQLLDADGKFTYSNIIAIRFNTGGQLHIFPNPVRNILFAEATGNSENAIAQIVDVSGRKVKELKVFLNGTTSFSVNVSSLASGVYQLILRKGGKTEVRRFLKR